MSDRIVLALLVAGMLLALGLGIWIGLGYPGLYDKYESTGTTAPRRTPFEMLVDWIVKKLGK